MLKSKSDAQFAALWRAAQEAGREAAAAHNPTPMVVQQHANMLDDDSPVVKEYFVSEGLCGFAYIRSKGNTPFGRWLKRAVGARPWYPTGVAVSINDYGQSYERKDAHARAAVKVLTDAGIEGVWAESRLD